MIRSGVMRSWLVVFALAFAGCGPIVYVNEVTRNAATKVDEARAAEADKYAPYWWTRAKEYLRKAKELAAHADFQAANRYGRLSSEAAEHAIAEAETAKTDPKRRAPAGKDLAPAKDGATVAPVAPAKDGAPVAPAKDGTP